MKNPDVLVVGSLHLDIVVDAKSLPVLDETARGSAWRMVCGGKGGNQACWSSRLGARTAMISQIGKDDFGRTLLANLKSHGVDASGVTIDKKAGSGMSVAIVNKDGEYGAVIVSGSNLTMNKQQVLSRLKSMGRPRIVLLQNEITEDINIAVALAAKKLGATVILNAAPARKLPRKLAECIDVLVVNRVEAAMLSGRKVKGRSSAAKAIRKLQSGATSVIVTLGADGLVVANAEKSRAIKPQKVKARSTHGAGDCFVAQLAACLAKDDDLFDAADRANRSAALFVSGKTPR